MFFIYLIVTLSTSAKTSKTLRWWTRFRICGEFTKHFAEQFIEKYSERTVLAWLMWNVWNCCPISGKNSEIRRHSNGDRYSIPKGTNQLDYSIRRGDSCEIYVCCWTSCKSVVYPNPSTRAILIFQYHSDKDYFCGHKTIFQACITPLWNAEYRGGVSRPGFDTFSKNAKKNQVFEISTTNTFSCVKYLFFFFDWQKYLETIEFLWKTRILWCLWAPS